MLVNVDPEEFGRIDLSNRNTVNGEDGIRSGDGFPMRSKKDIISFSQVKRKFISLKPFRHMDKFSVGNR
jgi:hypothetical protein